VLARRPYLPRSRVHFSSPSPSSRAWVEPSSNRAIAGRRAGHPRCSASIARTPSRFTSPRSSTTPSRARLSRSPAGIGVQTTAAAIVAARSFAPPVELPLPALLSSIRARGENPRDLLLLTDLFPLGFRGRHLWNDAAPPWPRQPPLLAVAERPCASSGAPAARLGAAELPWPPCCPAPQPPWPIASKPSTPRRRQWPWWPWRDCVARLLL
jgi:hypothetical protein